MNKVFFKKINIISDAERCFRYNAFYGRDNHFVFVGDSRVRQLYQASRSLLEKGQEPQFQQPEEPAHHDMTWKKKALNLRLDFFWAPLVDEDMIGVSFPKYCKKKIFEFFVCSAGIEELKVWFLWPPPRRGGHRLGNALHKVVKQLGRCAGGLQEESGEAETCKITLFPNTFLSVIKILLSFRSWKSWPLTAAPRCCGCFSLRSSPRSCTPPGR